MTDIITKTAHQKILRALDRTQFTALAFDIAYAKEEQAFATITFLDRPKYTFTIGEAAPDAPYRASMFSCKWSPGILWAQESSDADSWPQLANLLQTWVKNIRDELANSSPIYRDFDRFREEMMKKIAAVKADTDEGFTEEEQTRLSERLAKLESDYKSLREKDEIREKEFTALKKELKVLKTSLKHTPKKTWLRMASGKFFMLGQKILSTRAGQKVIEKATDRLLGP